MRPIILALCLASPAAAQNLPELTSPAPLAANIDATPKLMLTTPEAAKINASLSAFDTLGLQEILACEGAARSIRVMARSAEFYSFYFTESGMCAGAAHPFFTQALVTFDLSTGSPANWAKLLPESLLQTDAVDDDEARPLRSDALNTLYKAHLEPNPECDAAYAYPLAFTFALDAATKSLAMAPDALPYAETACAETALIPLAKIKSLGLDPRVITALETGKP